MNVGSICSRDVVTAEQEESVHKVAQRMNARKVGAIVVIKQTREPIGIITHHDLAMRIIAEGREPGRTLARDVMTTHPDMVDIHISVEEALNVMLAAQHWRIPVVDESGKLAGLISLHQIVASLSEVFQKHGMCIVGELSSRLIESKSAAAK